MKKSRLLMFTSLFALVAAAPALAQWERVGTVDVPSDGHAYARVSDMGTPVDRVRFRADGDVRCDRIRAVYDNGYDQDLFSGTLYEDRPQTVYFPEGARHIRDLSMNCRSADGDRTRVAVDVDSEPATHVTRVVYDEPPVADEPPGDSVRLADSDFGDLMQRSTLLTSARHVRAVEIEPTNADARCSRVTARFADGSSDDLVPNDGDRLEAGWVYRLEVTGRHRDLNSVSLTCRAADTDSVNINVYART